MSTNCIEPKGSTFSPENPRRWVLTGSNFSLPMPILSKADAKMMSDELPLSTRTLWTVLLAMTALITNGRHGDVGIPPGPNLRMLWLCQVEVVWTPLVLPLPHST